MSNDFKDALERAVQEVADRMTLIRELNYGWPGGTDDREIDPVQSHFTDMRITKAGSA